MTLPRRGIHPQLEAAANEMIRQSLKNVTRHSDKSDVLTPWKEKDRRDREVYVESGVPDPSIRRGMFHRAHNPGRPDLNSREGMARGGRGSGATLSSFVEENGYDPGPQT